MRFSTFWETTYVALLKNGVREQERRGETRYVFSFPFWSREIHEKSKVVALSEIVKWRFDTDASCNILSFVVTKRFEALWDKNFEQI